MSLAHIESAARRDAARVEGQLIYAQFLQTIVLPALIASIVWFREEILRLGDWLFFVLLFVFVALQAFLFIISIRAKHSVQDFYFYAKDLKSTVDELQIDVDAALMRAELYSFIEKYGASNASALLFYRGQQLDSNDLNRIVENILEPLVTNGEAIFRFGPTEKWNFVVYIYEPSRDALVPIWRRKGMTHPSEGLGREWGRGQGHVGFAFANSRPIITEDSRNPDVRNLVTATEGQARDYDESVYISFASMPIGPVADQVEPLGVVVATSDRPGRFSSENSRIMAHVALALANALSVVAPATVDALSSILRGRDDHG
jgi:GAF domain-containing protein